MKAAEFNRKVRTGIKPLIVDLWAPWCRPCKAMEPAFKQASQQYTGQVEVLKINADESPEVLKSLGVMSIPTVIAFGGGKEIMRRTGLQSAAGLEMLFEAALHQQKPAVIPPAPIHRVIRIVLGTALLIIGWFSGQSILIMALGGVVIFSAFYDRCPVYRAVATKLKSLFEKQGSKEQPN